MTIEQMREEINTINDEMLKLFLQRMEISREIGKIKVSEGRPFLDRKREEETLEWAASNSPLEIQSYSIEFFRNLMQLSRQFQEENIK